MGLRDLTNYFQEAESSDSGFISMAMKSGTGYKDTAIMMQERMNDDVDYKAVKTELL